MGLDRFTMKEEWYKVEGKLEPHPVSKIMPMMKGQEYEEFKENIAGRGLIDAIEIFQGKIIDGRNRYKACMELGIDVWCKDWVGGDDPIEYVIARNMHRRQLTTKQRAKAAAMALEYHRKQAKERQRAAGKLYGENHPKELVAPVPQALPTENKARDRAGKQFDVSGRSVGSADYVLKHGNKEEKEELDKPKGSLQGLEKKVRERVNNEKEKKKSKPTFNKTTESIDWAKYTWNPVTGCKHDCKYCYARDIANRFNENGFKPTFHSDRLSAPKNTKLTPNKNVFVCSMADLFGDWVDQKWIDKVMDICKKYNKWNYIFLTKNPKRLIDIEWSPNCFVGATVDCQDRVEPTVEAFSSFVHPPPVTFVSCEPLSEPLDFNGSLDLFDLVIIGGRSRSSKMPAFQPKWEWVEDLLLQARESNCSVFFKPNLETRPKELPDEWEK